ncbi:uncharacterized protein C8R40DRAFT_1175705 [Lentinula edodes]|uniref:uncharacterized protein n=1 Tax=Lentinula edodes TaxID=5353 RepID=UPI001E8E8D98|nr:uncharacterized protein C8R40DRAFT_1175705 [Lentinula edodes]KAH7870442.1 hypothetical protein C8R40DRAFT_1175705 [Lentinula edodes]
MAPTVTSIQPRYIKDGSEAITALSFSMDGHYLASASKDTYLRVYDVHANFKKIQSEPCSSSISAIAWNTPDSFITGNSDGELFISSLKQRGEKAELIYESSSPINAVELDKTRRMMLICAGAYVNVMEQQEVAFSFNAGFTCYSFNTNSWAKLDISVDSRKRAVVELSAQSIQGHLVVIRTIRGFVHEEPCRVVQILPGTHSIAQVKALAYSEDGLIATGDGDPGQNAHTNFWTSVILIRLIEYCSTTIRTILGEFLRITIILLILVLTLKTLPIETQKSIARAIISAIQQNKPEPVHSAHSSRLLPPYVLQHFLSGFRDGWERSSLDDVVELSAALQREIISITGTVSLSKRVGELSIFHTMNVEATLLRPVDNVFYMDRVYDFSYFTMDDDGMVWEVNENDADEPAYRPQSSQPQKDSAATPGAQRGRATSPKPTGGATVGSGHSASSPPPVSFASGRKAPKYRIKPSPPPIIGGKLVPGRLRTAPFTSRTSQGVTPWYETQSDEDLEEPMPVPAPALEGTVYIHRNMNDGCYQVWVWKLGNNGRKSWHPVDLDGDAVIHPKISDRMLRLTRNGKPSWILTSTQTTYESREIHRERAQSRARSQSRGPTVG